MGGILVDVVVGGVWQGIADWDMWGRDPGLALERMGANATGEAITGVMGGGTAAGIFVALGLLEIPIPPTWAIGAVTIVTTVFWDIAVGDNIKERLFPDE